MAAVEVGGAAAEAVVAGVAAAAAAGVEPVLLAQLVLVLVMAEGLACPLQAGDGDLVLAGVSTAWLEGAAEEGALVPPQLQLLVLEANFLS